MSSPRLRRRTAGSLSDGSLFTCVSSPAADTPAAAAGEATVGDPLLLRDVHGDAAIATTRSTLANISDCVGFFGVPARDELTEHAASGDAGPWLGCDPASAWEL